MNKYYLQCPDCGVRMVRTGKKIEVAPAVRDREPTWLYRIEYKCPNCGSFFIYSEDRNAIVPGVLPSA